MNGLFIYNCRDALETVIYGLNQTREPVTVERIDEMVVSGSLAKNHNDFYISKEEAQKIEDYVLDSRSFHDYSHISELHREFAKVLTEESPDYLKHQEGASPLDQHLKGQQRPSLWDSRSK